MPKIEDNDLKRLKRKMGLGWLIFVIALVATVFLWFQMNNAEFSYEEVNVKVLSARTKEVINKKTGSRTNFYDVKVEYKGKEYSLENAHNTYSYPQGKTVKAYLANNRLFADTDGVKTSTPIATLYFIFLFGTFGLLFLAGKFMGDYFQAKSLNKIDKK